MGLSIGTVGLHFQKQDLLINSNFNFLNILFN